MAMGKVTKSFKVTLDIARSISNREFSVVEGDTGNALSITLNDDGKAVDLTGCRVLALFSKSNGETVCQDSAEQNGGVTIGGQSMNEISIELFASSVAPGMVESEIQVYSGSDLTTLVTSAQFNFKCRRGGDTQAGGKAAREQRNAQEQRRSRPKHGGERQKERGDGARERIQCHKGPSGGAYCRA